MAIIDLDREQQIELLREADLDRLREVYRPLAESVASHYDGDQDRLVDQALTSIPQAVIGYLERGPDYRFDTYLTYYFAKGVEFYLEIQPL